MKIVTCPNYSTESKHDIAVARTVGLGLGVIAGRQGAIRALVVGAVGYLAGHIVDAIVVEYVDPTCPQCSDVIREAAAIVARGWVRIEASSFRRLLL